MAGIIPAMAGIIKGSVDHLIGNTGSMINNAQ